MNSKVLEIGGVDCMQLAKAAGTPLIVYDEHKIETQLEAAINSFRSEKFSTKVVYASKAFSCKAMYEKVKEAGACLDVVSGGTILRNAVRLPYGKRIFSWKQQIG